MKTDPLHLIISWLFLLGSSLTACSFERTAITPAPPREKEMTVFRRTDPTKEAIIFGHVDVIDPQTGIYSLSAAIISLNEKTFFANESGDYRLALSPGEHRLVAGQIGIHQSKLVLRVNQGDSIHLNFHLRPDSRPLN